MFVGKLLESDKRITRHTHTHTQLQIPIFTFIIAIYTLHIHHPHTHIFSQIFTTDTCKKNHLQSTYTLLRNKGAYFHKNLYRSYARLRLTNRYMLLHTIYYYYYYWYYYCILLNLNYIHYFYSIEMNNQNLFVTPPSPRKSQNKQKHSPIFF